LAGEKPVSQPGRRAPIYCGQALCWGAQIMAEADDRELQRAIKALLDRYQKDKVLAALERTPARSGPKRKDDTETLVLMGRMKAWRRNLSDRAAAEIFTRHLPDDSRRNSIIDRLRKRFSIDRVHYLRVGKLIELINLLIIETTGKRVASMEISFVNNLLVINKTRKADDSIDVLPKTESSDDNDMVTLEAPDDDTMEAKFQEVRSRLQAICVTDAATKQPVVICLKLKSREIREAIFAQVPSSCWEEFRRE
jgi:hypothetical protein